VRRLQTRGEEIRCLFHTLSLSLSLFRAVLLLEKGELGFVARSNQAAILTYLGLKNSNSNKSSEC
jgi:hypothetical protein